MSVAEKHVHQRTPESYSPKTKPVILSMVEGMKNMKKQNEVLIEEIGKFCSIVDREETKGIGIEVKFSAESRGWHADYGTNTDKAVAVKYIQNGTIKLLSNILGIENPEIIGVRTNIEGPGIYSFIIGIVVDNIENLPEHLPENSVTLICPPCRYAKFELNERKMQGRKGYDERMNADEYFVGGFRNDTNYVYNKESLPFNTYDETGDILTKYEPIKIPTNDSDKFDSIICKVVSIPDILCACSMTPPDSEEFVISKHFDIQDQIFSLECAKMYNDDYYGFPTNTEIKGKYNSYFGSQVSSFEGLPDCVEKMIISGGIYLHVSQLEVNGDNPSMLYDIAINHIEELFFNDNPKYKRDWSKHMFSRFRQANTSSIFIPLKYREC